MPYIYDSENQTDNVDAINQYEYEQILNETEVSYETLLYYDYFEGSEVRDA